jgi:hypothetical protein
LDNFKEFTTRYNNRIQNLKNYLNSGEYNILFIIGKVNNTSDNCKELDEIIKEKYPNLNYSFIYLEESRHGIFNECMNFDFL